MNATVVQVPARIALGRWENEMTFWHQLVERRQLHHLGNEMESSTSGVRDGLALGDEVFRGVFDLPRAQAQYEVLRRTEAFLHSSSLQRIYFDVTNIRLASRTYRIPSQGYFARKELELVAFDSVLFEKTRFFENGTPLWRNGNSWFEVLTLRFHAQLRPDLLARTRQRKYLESLLES
jgi:hypothetical protein